MIAKDVITCQDVLYIVTFSVTRANSAIHAS